MFATENVFVTVTVVRPYRIGTESRGARACFKSKAAVQ